MWIWTVLGQFCLVARILLDDCGFCTLIQIETVTTLWHHSLVIVNKLKIRLRRHIYRSKAHEKLIFRVFRILL